MRAVRIPTAVIAAALMIGLLAYAQTSPDIALPPGDAARGKAIFESSTKGNCLSCHRVQGTGSLFGPDLSTVAIAPAVGGGRGGQVGPDVSVYIPSFEEGTPRRPDNATLPQETGAAGAVRHVS